MSNTSPPSHAPWPVDQPPYPTDPFRTEEPVRTSARVNELLAFSAAMEQLHHHLMERFENDRSGNLSGTLQAALELCGANCLVHLKRNPQGTLVPHIQVRRRDFVGNDPLWQELSCHAENACRGRTIQQRQLVSAPQWQVVVTAARIPTGPPEALALFLDQKTPSDPMIGPLLQVVAQLVSLDASRSASEETKRDAHCAFGACEILQRLARADTTSQAAHRLASDLLEWQAASRAAVGIVHPLSQQVSNISIAGLSRIEEQSQSHLATRALMRDTLRGQQAISWQRDVPSSAPLPNSLDRFAQLTDAQWIVVVPLLSTTQHHLPDDRSAGPPPNSSHAEFSVGCLLLWGGQDCPFSPRILASCKALGPGCADVLLAVQDREAPLRQRVARQIRRLFWGTPGKRWSTRIAVALLALAHVPRPYVVPCKITIRPVTRRFVAVPFDARLQQCLVRPGDLVKEGQTLAQLDGKELELDWSQRQAEHNAESKKRDVAMAAGERAEVQQAEAQMERLALQIQLLEKQLGELEIQSPLSGVVLQGELQDAVGAPLDRGETLFEIGPLEQLKAELFIADEEIEFVQIGSRVNLQLHTGQHVDRHARIRHIDPAAQVVEQENSFRAEVLLDNQQGNLRPGQSGEARIYGPWRPWLWNVLRRPWIELRSLWGT